MKNTKERIINCPHCGKILSHDLWEKPKLTSTKLIKCPACGSTKNWKSGKRKDPSGEIQRYICRDCALRFSHSG